MTSKLQGQQLSWLQGKRVSILCACVVAILILGTFVCVQSTFKLLNASDWVVHSLEVQRELDKTYATLLEVEAAQRNFLIVGDDLYSQQFEQRIQATHEQLDRLQNMTSDNSQQQANISRLSDCIDYRLKLSRDIVALRLAQGFNAAKGKIATGAGTKAMEDVTAALGTIENEESRLLEHRNKALSSYAVRLLATYSMTILIIVALLTGVYLLVRRDNIQRAVAAELMQRSEQQFRTFMDNSPLVAFSKDAQGRFTYVNAVFEKVFQRSAQDVLGKTDLDLWPPETARQIQTNDRLVWNERRSMEFTESVPLASGEIRQWTAYKFLFSDPSGRALVGGFKVDVTERMQAEERFRLAVQSCPNGMIMVDQAGTIVLVNTQTERMFGYSQVELVGQPIEMLVPTRFRKEHPQRRNDFMAHPKAREMGTGLALFGVRKDGSEFPLEIGLNPIRMGNELLVLSAIVDITERKRAESEMKRFTARLKQSNRELQDFAYVSSHDLQEPLRKIQAFGDRLKIRCNSMLPEEGRDYVDRMQKAATRMRTLIEDLLAFSRVTSKAQPFVSVNLNEVLAGVLEDLEVRIVNSGARISICEFPNIDADPLQMRQLFQNLIGNALKFQRPGMPPEISIDSEICNAAENDAAGPCCQIVVQDNGIGFEEKYSMRIFDVFQRLHERDKYEGSGIGLSICRKIVERHGGRISAHSAPGSGATFTVMLPVHQFNPSNENQESEEALCHAEEAFSC